MRNKKIGHSTSKIFDKSGKMNLPIGMLDSLRDKVSKHMGSNVSLDEIKKCLNNIKNNDSEGLDELVDGNGSFISGDYNPNNRETFVGINRPETSREFSMYTSQGPRYYYTPHYGASRVYTRESIAENKMKNMIEDIIQGKMSDYQDIMKNNKEDSFESSTIPDLSELKTEYQKPIIARKTKYLTDMLDREGANGEEIAIVLNHLMSSLDLSKISEEHKSILISKLKNV